MPYSKAYKRGVKIPSAAAVIQHGQLVQELGYVGVAVKQAAYTINTPRSQVAQIAIGEQYVLITKGEVETPALSGATLGEAVCITIADNTLHLGAPGGGQVKVGRVSALPGTYGEPGTASGAGTTPVIPSGGLMRVDLDAKDSF